VKNAWKKYGKTTTGVLPVESCLVQSRGVFIQKIRFSPLETIQEADAAWPEWQDHAQLGEAHLAQVKSLPTSLSILLFNIKNI